MKRTTKNLITVAVAAALFAPMAAMATNGYFAHGYGTKNKGLAGSGVALPQDAMIAATNPAGMVFVGERLDVGAAVFSPNPRGYEATGAPTGACGASAFQCTFGLDEGKVTSGDDMFLVPHIASNWMLDANSSIGVTVYGNGGMNTKYDSSDASATYGGPPGPFPGGTTYTSAGTYGAGGTGVNLSQLFIGATYARKFNDKSSWGITPVFVYQRFEAKGLALFGAHSNDPTKLSNNGVDTSTGYGLKLGVQGEVAPGFNLAASYQSRMEMTEFDKYAGLFAEEGDFDVPATVTVGLAWSASPTMVVTADVQQIYYSQVKSIANPISHLTDPVAGCGFTTGDTTQCLGGSDGAGFGWEDMTIFKLGFQMQQSADLTLRAGLSYGEQPIPEEETLFNIIAPAVITTHITFGLTQKLSADSEFNFAGMYAPSNSVKGDSPFDPAQEIEIEMSQWELEGSYSMNF